MGRVTDSKTSLHTRSPLTDARIRAAKTRGAGYRLPDGGCGGLHLFVTPAGGKVWRLRHWRSGKDQTLGLGSYPEIGLAEARKLAIEARSSLAHGINPVAAKAKRAECTFKMVAVEWLDKFSGAWSQGYQAKIRDRLEKQLYPWLGDRPIGEITAAELLAVVRRVESRGAIELSHRCLQLANAVFRYAVVSGLAERNPAGDLAGALTPVSAKHHAALTEPKAVGGLLRAIDGFQGTFIVACALRLLPLVFTRQGELRRAEWNEINPEAAEWRLSATKMKMREPHIVPLSRQAVAILRELQPLTGSGRYCFPSERTADRPMSENTVNAALRRLGFAKTEMTGHGFRSTASTLLNELGFKPDLIERQLAHRERNQVRAAYNRAEYLEERRAMMQAWADYLDSLKAGGQVIALKRSPTKGL